MKARLLFRENGTVIHTRTPLLQRLQPWAVALLVAIVILVLPGLLDPPPPIDDAGAVAELMAMHEQELQAMQMEVMRAYQRGVSDALQAASPECQRRRQL